MPLRNILSKSAWCGLIALILTGAGICSAQTISVVSGDGQLILTNRISNQPLVVQVKDAAGNPVVGAAVTWTVQGQGNLTLTQSTTDANGQSSTAQNFIAPSLFASQTTAYIQSTVSASLANGATANFIETTYFQDPVTSADFVQAFLIAPTLGTTLTGQGGVPGNAPIQVHVQAINGTQTGQGINHIAVQILADNATGPTVVCQGGIVYTNSLGDATCTPVFGGVGSGTFTIVVGGGKTNFCCNPFSVVLGTPSTVQIISGNNQSGTPGMTLPVPITAAFVDLAGNGIPNIPVVFEAETPGTATFSNVRNATDATGRISANVILGTIAGTYKIRVRTTSGTPILGQFTFTVMPLISGLTKVSGEPQSALVNTAFSAPLIVQVNDAALKGIPGATVTFTVSSGSGAVGTPSVTTDVNGRAATTVTAGPAAGPLNIVATSGAFAVSFALSVSPPGPVCTAANFSNTVSSQPGGLAPGAIVTLTCPGLAPTIQGTVVPQGLPGNFVPIALAGDTVQFNGIYAPIFSVSNILTPFAPQQSIAVQVPFEVAPGAANVTVTVNGVAATFGAAIQPFSPGILEWTMSDNVRRAFVVRPDGTVVNPTNPARRNEVLRVYATGLGAVTPPVGTNQLDPIDSDPAVLAQTVVGVNNAGVNVISAAYARNLVGVYEIRFMITDPGPSGPNIPFAVAVASGTLFFAQPSLLPVQ